MEEDPRIETAARAWFNLHHRRGCGKPWSKLHWSYRNTYINTARTIISAADKIDPLRVKSGDK